MTATLSCDYAGADAAVRAYLRALANGTQLRLVVTAHFVRRVLSLNGLDHLIPIYPSLEAAIAAGTPAVEGPAETRVGAENLYRRRVYDHPRMAEVQPRVECDGMAWLSFAWMGLAVWM